MAANPLNPSEAGTGPFAIHADAAPSLPPTSPSLPNGSCNFVDLTPGTNGAKCGCRRFWPRQVMGNTVVDQPGWCMCAHHACFHDNDGPRDELQQQRKQQQHQNSPQRTSFDPLGQGNGRPCTGREPLSPVADASVQGVSTVPAIDFSALSPDAPLSFVHEFETEAEGTPKQQASRHPPGSMPDTLAWDEYMQTPWECPRPSSDPMALPPSPSQFLIASQTTSTTSSHQAKYQRPFAGKGLGTLDVTATGSVSSRPQHPQTSNNTKFASVAPRDPDTSNGDFVFVDRNIPGREISQPNTATQDEPRVTAACHKIYPETLQHLSEVVSGHEERLDRLETVSFSANGHEECVDLHDHMDLRVTELEQRMEGVEKTLDVAGLTNKQADEEDDGVKSVLSAALSSASLRNQDEIMSQIDSLRAQVGHLQSFLPSHGHAWTIEAVFLPFPLKRLWQEVSQFKTDASISNDDWTQIPMALSSPTLRSQSPFGGDDWDVSDHDAEWLYPRACGDKSTQDKRLRSRGLIQTVSLCGPDARSVQAAIHEAFGPVFRTMGIAPRRQFSDPRLSRYLGLQGSWVPLRKVHKDSRLRFLSAAEMLTPTSWDVGFLHSVAMKSAEPRLFITHPDAYIQDYKAYESGWAWQRIREMDRASTGVSESQEVKEADAREHCWLWNEQLDELPAVLTSLNMRQRRQRTYSPALVAHEQGWRSVSPAGVRNPSPRLSAGRRSAPRPPHIRTASAPLTAQPIPRATSRRRVVSHAVQPCGHLSPLARGPTQGIQKRRCTRSPSYLHHTPRWTASLSPMPSPINDQQIARGMTPPAYATPFSNAPLQELRPIRGTSVARSGTSHVPLDYPTDEHFDVEIYDSGDDSYCDDQESISSGEVMSRRETHRGHAGQLPEDEPWPGIEDRDPSSNGENVDPDELQGSSEGSSQPSEHPSAQQAWPSDGIGFKIHEDEGHEE
ncbi:uncharacterized protein MAM_05572 [Metarhizium album ARSEF 1941]|uniref:Uncharacterized protein n=1 Tax=Metarhizium album (strain ARSEF 1941) TaxID=1081103 RepID=A0A0B2WSN3_METAS|nr:uncharacterized protein MAM_05572 [Metarhizium album ARSEF 1941]KHN96629.1 hypothetical protein MAM_05572 [Metarhizium album ARSEF 1941]